MEGYYNVYEKRYNNNKNDLDTYYVLYDDKFNFIQRFEKKDLNKVMRRYSLKYTNTRNSGCFFY